MSALLPDPAMIGLPAKFTHWRPGQDRAILAAVDSKKRFIVQNAPTGFGKTIAYMAQALLSGARTAVLTASKGLQSQLLHDFAECGLVDVRGQNNYKCRALQPGGDHYSYAIAAPSENCDSGPCHAGAFCSLRKGGCHYFDAVAVARNSRLVVTNYTYWIAQHRYSEGLGAFDLLVMDEAHDAPDELAQSMEVEISEFDVQTLLGITLPHGEDPLRWKEWGTGAASVAARRWDALDAGIKQGSSSHTVLREAHTLKNLLKRLQVIAQMEGGWLVERRPKSARIAPIWPAPYAERYLFLNTPKIVFVSATVKEKTLELLGVKPGEFEFHEYPSTFPVARRPVIPVPSVRCNHNWSEIEQRTWVRRIDQIISKRLDRKGIVHTTSYDRRNLVLTYSEHRAIMLFNDGTNTRTTVEKFRNAAPPCVLVSPSLTTGWDLPFEECEYSIIGKIPFPDTRSPITKARTEQDADYGPYLAVQVIVQASGRGMRSVDDQCEIFILDENWRWFWPKYKKFAPNWFAAAVPKRPQVTIPDPLPKLTTVKVKRSSYV